MGGGGVAGGEGDVIDADGGGQEEEEREGSAEELHGFEGNRRAGDGERGGIVRQATGDELVVAG
jgi:hypothetical protein